jgi:hypothetical protein
MDLLQKMNWEITFFVEGNQTLIGLFGNRLGETSAAGEARILLD